MDDQYTLVRHPRKWWAPLQQALERYVPSRIYIRDCGYRGRFRGEKILSRKLRSQALKIVPTEEGDAIDIVIEGKRCFRYKRPIADFGKEWILAYERVDAEGHMSLDSGGAYEDPNVDGLPRIAESILRSRNGAHERDILLEVTFPGKIIIVRSKRLFAGNCWFWKLARPT